MIRIPARSISIVCYMYFYPFCPITMIETPISVVQRRHHICSFQLKQQLFYCLKINSQWIIASKVSRVLPLSIIQKYHAPQWCIRNWWARLIVLSLTCFMFLPGTNPQVEISFFISSIQIYHHEIKCDLILHLQSSTRLSFALSHILPSKFNFTYARRFKTTHLLEC